MVLKGERPSRPNAAEELGFTELLWSYMQRCWEVDVNLRPTCREFLDVVENQ